METKIVQKTTTEEGVTVRLKHTQQNQQLQHKGMMGNNVIFLQKQQTESKREIKLEKQCGITGTLHHALTFIFRKREYFKLASG